mgnify:FL=1
MTDRPGPMRVPPELGVLNTDFWTGGLSGELRIQRCDACSTWHHPPTSRCRACLATTLTAHPVSGKATVLAYTINHQQWSPTATTDPYVIAIVELAEQVGVRITSNVVNCDVREVYIGMPVRVVFEPLADVAVPLFEPDR